MAKWSHGDRYSNHEHIISFSQEDEITWSVPETIEESKGNPDVESEQPLKRASISLFASQKSSARLTAKKEPQSSPGTNPDAALMSILERLSAPSPKSIGAGTIPKSSSPNPLGSTRRSNYGDPLARSNDSQSLEEFLELAETDFALIDQTAARAFDLGGTHAGSIAGAISGNGYANSSIDTIGTEIPIVTKSSLSNNSTDRPDRPPLPASTSTAPTKYVSLPNAQSALRSGQSNAQNPRAVTTNSNFGIATQERSFADNGYIQSSRSGTLSDAISTPSSIIDENLTQALPESQATQILPSQFPVAPNAAAIYSTQPSSVRAGNGVTSSLYRPNQIGFNLLVPIAEGTSQKRPHETSGSSVPNKKGPMNYAKSSAESSTNQAKVIADEEWDLEALVQAESAAIQSLQKQSASSGKLAEPGIFPLPPQTDSTKSLEICAQQNPHATRFSGKQDVEPLTSMLSASSCCYRLVPKKIDHISAHQHDQMLPVPRIELICSPDNVESVIDSMVVLVIVSGTWLQNRDYISLGRPISVVDIVPPFNYISNPDVNTACNASSRIGIDIILYVNDNRGLVTICPDELVSPTRVVDACACERRSVVATRTSSPGLPVYSAPATLGSLKHECIEAFFKTYFESRTKFNAKIRTCTNPKQREALVKKAECWLQSQLHRIADNCVLGHLEELLLLKISDSEAKTMLYSTLTQTLPWLLNVANTGIASAAKIGLTTTGPLQLPLSYGITGLLEVEETIWSPHLGLSGKLDMVLRATIQPSSQPGTGRNHSSSGVRSTGDVLLPLELKTGRWHPAKEVTHRAQVIMYILMMMVRDFNKHSAICEANRANIEAPLPANEGLLLYVSEAECKLIPIVPSWREVVGLMMQRNMLAFFISQPIISPNPSSAVPTSILPPMLRNERDCGGCFQAAECMLYHAAIENGTPSTSGAPAVFHDVVSTATALHLSYIRHWESLLDLEQESTKATNMKIWSERSEMRESRGEACLCALQIEELARVGSSGDDQSVSTFIPADPDGSESKCFLLTITGTNNVGSAVFRLSGDQVSVPLSISERSRRVGLTVGDRVVLSLEFYAGTRANSKTFLASSEMDSLRSPQGNSTIPKGIADIEDMVVDKFRTLHVVDVEPNIISGSIVAIKSDAIVLTTSAISSRLQRKISEARSDETLKILFRLDKDARVFGMSTLRSNILALFASAHDPSTFAVRKKQKSTTSSSSSIAVSSSSSQQGTSSTDRASVIGSKLRRLIVDLEPPTIARIDFPGNENFDAVGDLRMFFPIHLDSEIVRHAIIELDTLMMEAAFQQDELSQAIPVVTANKSTNGMVKSENSAATGEYVLSCGIKIHSGCNPLELFQDFQRCNSGQRSAIRRVLSASDYSILQGYPGSGKSTVLSIILRSMVARGQRVLLTSYTHAAVDNVLEKIAEAGVAPELVLRVGGAAGSNTLDNSSSRETVKSIVEDSTMSTSREIVEQYRFDVSRYPTIVEMQRKCVDLAKIVACTVLAAARSPLVASFTYDCCVVDEAGQITEPATIGALLLADSFVLVGDHYQLPPLVVSKEARDGGMSISLMSRLADAHPSSVVALTDQYRMNNEIMSICNALYYDNKMGTGSTAVGDAKLMLPRYAELQYEFRQNPIFTALMTAIDPNRPVVFLNISSVSPANSISRGRRVVLQSNAEEAKVVVQCVNLLARCQCNVPESVGIIAPYRSQLSEINAELKRLIDIQLAERASVDNSSPGINLHCEISTVDRFQGRDKDVIIISTVKSMGDESVRSCAIDIYLMYCYCY